MTMKRFTNFLIALNVVLSILLIVTLKGKAKELDRFIEYRNGIQIESYVEEEIGDRGTYCIDKVDDVYVLTWYRNNGAEWGGDNFVMIADLTVTKDCKVEVSNIRGFVNGKFHDEYELKQMGMI